MRNWISAAIIVASFVVVGCKNDDMMKDDMMKKEQMEHGMSTTKPMMMGDACEHCPGMQKATADGKCPVCGMKAM